MSVRTDVLCCLYSATLRGEQKDVTCNRVNLYVSHFLHGNLQFNTNEARSSFGHRLTSSSSWHPHILSVQTRSMEGISTTTSPGFRSSSDECVMPVQSRSAQQSRK